MEIRTFCSENFGILNMQILEQVSILMSRTFLFLMEIIIIECYCNLTEWKFPFHYVSDKIQIFIV